MKIIIFVIIITFIGCGESANFNRTTLRGLPVNPKWSLKGKLVKKNKLNTSCVYLFESKGERIYYAYYKFWDTGQVVSSCAAPMYPSVTEINSFYCTKVGYYTIKGNKVIIELFTYENSQFFWTYNKEHFLIENGSLFFYKTKSISRKSYTVPLQLYCPGILSAKPDW